MLQLFSVLGSRQHKNLPELICSHPRFGKLDSSTDSCRLRKFRVLEAKLHELDRLQQQRRMHTQGAQSLQQKVLRNPLYLPGSWRQRLKQVAALVPKKRQKEQQHRGFALRGSLCRAATPSVTSGSSGGRCSKAWLPKSFKSVSLSPWFRKLFMSSKLTGSKSGTELLLTSKRCGSTCRTNPSTNAGVMTSGPGLALLTVLLREKAGSFDGWSGAEVASISSEHWNIFCDFTQWIETAGLGPSSWKQFNHCHIPSPKPLTALVFLT